MITASKIQQALKEQGVTHVVGLPDNICRELFRQLDEDPEIEVIQVSREGEAYALAAGLYLGGGKPLVLIQNTGFLESGDAFRGTSYNMRIPQVMLMGYRGYATLSPESERKDTSAVFLEPTLKAWDIPYFVMHGDNDILLINQAFEKVRSTSLPVAVLISQTTV